MLVKNHQPPSIGKFVSLPFIALSVVAMARHQSEGKKIPFILFLSLALAVHAYHSREFMGLISNQETALLLTW